MIQIEMVFKLISNITNIYRPTYLKTIVLMSLADRGGGGCTQLGFDAIISTVVCI